MAKSNDNAAGVYAQALYDAAQQAGVVPQIYSELESVADVLQKHASTGGEFFASPAVGFDEKAQVYRKAFQGKIHPLLLNFILTVAKHGRSPAMFPQCLLAFRELSNAQDGVAELEVRSARKLSDAELEKLTKTMARKLNLKVHVTEKVEPELLGGFIVLHQNQQWDASVSSRLHKLQNGLKEAKFPSSVLKD
jgi:F-type H+-transporting ATPase subunit delta